MGQSIVEIVTHYQKSIDKSLKDEERLLHCLNKLYKLPISVQHLQETGIGRTVNALRKYDGEIGVASKALVTKWKHMVAAEESEEGEQSQMNNESSENNNTEDDEHSNDESQTKSLDNESLRVKEEKPDSHKHHNDTEETTSKLSSRNSSSHSRSKSSSSHNHHKSSSSGHHEDAVIVKLEKQPSHKIKLETTTTNNHIDKAINGEVTSSEQRHNSSSRHKSSHKSSSSNSKRKRSSSPEVGRKEVKKEKVDSDDNDTSSKEIKMEKDRNHKDKTKSSSSSSSHRHHSSEKEKSRSSKDHSSDSKRHSEGVKKERKSEKHDKVGSERDATKDTRKNHSQSSSSTVKRKADSSTEQKVIASSSSKKSSSKSSKETEESSKNCDSDGVEIDQSEGFGFAEALGMLDMPTKKSGAKKLTVNTSVANTSAALPVFVKPAPVEKKVKMDTKSLTTTPQLLTGKVKLEPVPDAEIVSALPIMPTISPNYRPMPLNPVVMDCVFANNRPMKRQMTDDEALGASTSSRNHRTKIYSGVKASGPANVPSLIDLCYRIIQDHIELIEYTGGVPYYILKPILQKATADQLATFEHYNPYLMEESDALWEVHVNRRFKGKKRIEFESWREMYFRCMDEQQERLEKLTKKVKHHQEISIPVKTTKLAYVDSAVKPPRNVANKQRQFGTERIKVVSPAARVASMNGMGLNIAKAGDFRLKVAPGVRDTAQAVSHGKPRKAPLMAKTLQALKAGRLFKR